MKRLIMAALIFLALALPVNGIAGNRVIYLMNESGVTINESGTSTLLVSGISGNATIAGFDTQVRTCCLQVITLTPGTPYDSGATFSILYKGSMVDSEAYWEAAGTSTLISGLALSGNTLYINNFTPEYCKYLRFEFTSGTSPFKAVKFILGIE